MSSTRNAILVLVLAAACLASSRPAQEPGVEDVLRQTRNLYGSASWTAGPRRDGLPLAALELDGWVGRPLRSDQGRLKRTFAASDARRAPTVLVVEAHVAETALEAHATLVRWLAGRQAPDPAPRASERGIELGDVAFAGPTRVRDADALAWLAFVRGNVAVRVVNADPFARPELDLAAVAGALDAAVVARPTLADDQPLPRPVVERLEAKERSVEAGAAVRLDVEVRDPGDGAPHLEWAIGGTGQGYVEREDDAWVLHTTGTGAIELTLGVTGSNGAYAESSLELTATGG